MYAGYMLATAVREVHESPRRVRLQLWLLAILFFGVGDMLTTGVGLGIDGVVEAGPVTEPLVSRFGLVVIPMAKAGVFGLGYLLWRVVPDPHSVGVPLGLAVVGVCATVWNVHVLARALVA